MDLSFEINDFLTKEEIKALLVLHEKIPKTANEDGQKKAFTSGFPIGLLPKSIKSKIDKTFINEKVTVTMILEEFEPWTVHTDYFLHGYPNPSYAALIPLDHNDKQTHTVVFNEQGTTQDWKRLLQEDKDGIDKSHLQLLSHVEQDLLKKLSVRSIYRWKPGKLIAWHRKLLHTSDNFHFAGLDKKIALVLWMNKND